MIQSNVSVEAERVSIPKLLLDALIVELQKRLTHKPSWCVRRGDPCGGCEALGWALGERVAHA